MILTATCSYKKLPGTLSLLNKTLTWKPAQNEQGSLHIQGNQMTSLFASKAGSPKIILRIGVVSEPGSHEVNHNFTFINASSAVSDREHFKQRLSEILAANKQTATSSPASTPNSAASPRTTNDEKALQERYNVSLRLRLLKQDPELRYIHENLVLTGQISEDEFWSTREHLLAAQQQQDEQKQGRSATLVDARPELSNEGEIRVLVTPQLISDIFSQHPVVQRAYNENVPPMTQEQFWQRFFSSKLYNKIRASSRQAGDTIKDDAVFDKYLEIEEEEQAPKELDTSHIYRLLDLAATEEDHGETGNEKDFTMRYNASSKASLPLIRRFNQHSERMLQQALGAQGPGSGQIQAGDASRRNYEADIVLEDLQGVTDADRIVLDMDDDQNRFYTGDPNQSGFKMDAANAASVIKLKHDIHDWVPDLGEYTFDAVAFEDAKRHVLGKLQLNAVSKSSSRSHAIPESVLRQLVSLQTSTNEFLRQFWASVLPPRPGDNSYAAIASPLQKAARAEKMAGYLSKTPERVEHLYETVRRDVGGEFGLDRVRASIQPVLVAVQNAVDYYQARTS